LEGCGFLEVVVQGLWFGEVTEGNRGRLGTFEGRSEHFIIST